MCGALNRSAQRTPVDGHLTCVCCSYPSQPQCARRLADSAHGVGELTPTSRQWGATPSGSALNFASAIWLPLLHCMLAFRGRVLYALAVPPALLLLWCATYSHRTASTAAALMRSRIQEALSDVYRHASHGLIGSAWCSVHSESE